MTTSPRLIQRTSVPTPIGAASIYAVDGAVCALGFDDEGVAWAEPLLERRFGPVVFEDGADPGGAASRLRAYLGGELSALDAVRVDLGGTEFQRLVWAGLRTIPTSATVCYSELAAAIGRPLAIRAVGVANSRNPVAIVVPCHRVIGADGSLTGYAGGLDRKRWLLDHERRHATAARRPAQAALALGH